MPSSCLHVQPLIQKAELGSGSCLLTSSMAGSDSDDMDHTWGLWHREHSGGDGHVSTLSTCLQEGASDVPCDITGGAHCLPEVSFLESDVHSTRKLDSMSSFLCVWNHFVHILNSSTHFVMSPPLPLRRPSNGLIFLV